MKKISFLFILYFLNLAMYGQCEDVMLNAEYQACAGDVINLSVIDDPNYSYQWFYEGELIPNEFSASIQALNSGTYMVEVAVDMNTVCNADTEVIFNQVSGVVESTSPAVDNEGLIKICVGEEVAFTATEVMGATYTWNFGSNGTAQGATVSSVFNTPGVYDIELIVTNSEGCSSGNDSMIKVVVAEAPLVTFTGNTQICLGDSITVTAQAEENTIASCNFSSEAIVFLPDDNGTTFYETCITVNCFDQDTTIQSIDDISSICLNIEHSYVGDLDIVLIAPDGAQVVLKSFAAGGGDNYLGEPVEPDSDLSPGTGYEYCFTQNADTLLIEGDTIPVEGGNTIIAGDYLPEESFENFIGSPLNGDWCLLITDNLASDNGYFFGFDLSFASGLNGGDFIVVPNPIVSMGWEASDTGAIINDTTIEITPDEAGTFCYEYTVEDSFGCSHIQQYCVEVNEASVVTTPDDMIGCDDDDDWILEFDLTFSEAQILDGLTGGPYIVTYYEIQANADGEFNPIVNPTMYPIQPSLIEVAPSPNAGFQVIYIVVTDAGSGCKTQTTLRIRVDLLPVIATPPNDLELINTDGTFGIFDLTVNEIQMLGSQDPTLFVFTYFETEMDCNSSINAIPDPTLYQNIVNPQTMYVQLQNIETGCFVCTSFDLIVLPDETPDSDNDGITDVDEDLNNNGDLDDDDTDEDGIPNYLDDDDDGDSVPTAIETEGIGSGFGPDDVIDTDGDTIPNYLDNDDDGDGVLTIDEDYNDNGTPLDDDTNGNSIPDFLDADVTLGVDSNTFRNFTVFPNPAFNTITIDFAKTVNAGSVSVVTVNGQVVLQQSFKSATNFTVDVSRLNSGIYFIQTVSEEGKSIQKFIKK